MPLDNMYSPVLCGAVPSERLSDWADLWGSGVRAPVLHPKDKRKSGACMAQPLTVLPVR